MDLPGQYEVAKSHDVDILVVEDDHEVRSTLAEILRRDGYTVLEAEDGAAALKILQATRLGLVLLDLSTPNMDGFQLLDQAAELPPVVLLTARTFDAEIENRRSEIAGYLQKPWKPEHLLALVRGCLGPTSETSNPVSAPLQSHDGLWVSASFQDVTVVQHIVGALMVLEERFRASVQSLTEGLSIFTAIRDDTGKLVDFRCEFVNFAGASITGFQTDELIGRRLLEVLPENGPNGMFDVYRRVVETGEPWANPTVWFEDSRAGGEMRRRACDMSATKLGDGIVIVTRDVTDLREQEQTLKLRTAQLEASNAQLEARSKVMNHLAQGTSALQKCSRLKEAIEIMGRAGPFVFEGSAGAIYTPAPIENRMDLVESWGGFTGSDVIMRDECWAMRSRTPHIFGDDTLALRCLHAPESARWTACIPVLAQGDVLGLIHVQQSPVGSHSSRETVELLGTQWGLTLSNLRLQESLREQSVRDPLTGLFNRRYLDEALEQEVHRAERQETPLCLVMLDLDFFKSFNDTHGHPAGDIVLRDLGRFLLQRTRGSDVVGRFGGEEFLMIMPGATTEVAPPRIEDMLAKWRGRDSEASSPGFRPFPTISAGLAQYFQGQTATGLLIVADRALYQAKESGRDQLVVASSASWEPADQTRASIRDPLWLSP